MKRYGIENTPSIKDARKRTSGKVNYLNFVIEDELLEKYKKLSYFVETYGCQGNEADSETIKGILESLGMKEASEIEKADFILLNTCAIRENAENKVFGKIGSLKHFKKTNEFMRFAVCGCMPQEEVVVQKIMESYPYVDLVFGTHNIAKLPEYVDKIYTSDKKIIEVMSEEGDIYEELPKTRDLPHKAWVNIMFGCNEFCSYCIVPYTRGKERSRKASDIIEEVSELVKLGYLEITLLGQNVNKYGKDFESDYGFSNLLEDLTKTGIKRIKFTTSHPKDFTSETIDVIAKYDSILPFIHLPVQSGSNTVLAKMNRKYTRERYLELVKEIKSKIPGVSITTDIIVGFPGETESDFRETISLVEEVEFEGAYTFLFSKRVGTPANEMEITESYNDRKQRLYRLNKVVNDGYLKGNERFVGEVVEVLVDGKSKNNLNTYSGYSENNKLVNFTAENDDCINKIVKVKITKAMTWFLLGEIV